MSYKWYENKSFFTNEKELISEYYSALEYVKENENVKLIGELYIKEINDSYTIEIIFLDAYPNSLPIVKEIGDDIPKELNRHISYDGNCCLCVPQLEKYYFPKNSNIKDFLDKLVVPFFVNQAYFDMTGKWINGEYSHGYLGVYEFYSDFFRLKDTDIISEILKIVTKSIPNLNKKCPCSSGKSIKKCHMDKIIEIRKIVEIEQIKSDISNLNSKG